MSTGGQTAPGGMPAGQGGQGGNPSLQSMFQQFMQRQQAGQGNPMDAFAQRGQQYMQNAQAGPPNMSAVHQAGMQPGMQPGNPQQQGPMVYQMQQPPQQWQRPQPPAQQPWAPPQTQPLTGSNPAPFQSPWTMPTGGRPQGGAAPQTISPRPAIQPHFLGPQAAAPAAGLPALAQQVDDYQNGLGSGSGAGSGTGGAYKRGGRVR